MKMRTQKLIFLIIPLVASPIALTVSCGSNEPTEIQKKDEQIPNKASAYDSISSMFSKVSLSTKDIDYIINMAFDQFVSKSFLENIKNSDPVKQKSSRDDFKNASNKLKASLLKITPSIIDIFSAIKNKKLPSSLDMNNILDTIFDKTTISDMISNMPIFYKELLKIIMSSDNSSLKDNIEKILSHIYHNDGQFNNNVFKINKIIDSFKTNVLSFTDIKEQLKIFLDFSGDAINFILKILALFQPAFAHQTTSSSSSKFTDLRTQIDVAIKSYKSNPTNLVTIAIDFCEKINTDAFGALWLPILFLSLETKDSGNFFNSKLEKFIVNNFDNGDKNNGLKIDDVQKLLEFSTSESIHALIGKIRDLPLVYLPAAAKGLGITIPEVGKKILDGMKKAVDNIPGITLADKKTLETYISKITPGYMVTAGNKVLPEIKDSSATEDIINKVGIFGLFYTPFMKRLLSQYHKNFNPKTPDKILDIDIMKLVSPLANIYSSFIK